MPKMETSSKYANANRIRTIDFARSGIDGTGTMSPRARRALAVYVVLIRMGFCGVIAPMGAIADAVFRSSHGESGSIRTLQRAHRELEERGYIRCAVHRPGRRARGAIVHFCVDAFSYWTQIRQNNVSPLPTQEHISADATSCRPPDRTRDQDTHNSSNSLEKVNTEPRAGARANKKRSPNRPKKNAVLFSVDKALQKMVDRTHRADRTAARARARCEVAAIAAGIALVNPSGVDWEYWGRQWTDMSWQVREATAAREIIPLLLPSADLARSTAPAAISPSPVLEQLVDVTRPTEEQIREVRQRLEAQLSLPVPTESASRNDAGVYPDVDESDPEMQLLVQARARVRARAVNGG